MIREDNRGRRVAIVPDFMINPDAAFYRDIEGRTGPVLDVLMDDGWGIMKAPPHVLSANVGASAVTTIAGDAVDYLRHGYTVAILAVEGLAQGGIWLEPLEAAFRELRTAMPKVIKIPLGKECTASFIRAKLTAATAPKISQCANEA